jgi:hypothetical protein
VAGDVGVIGTTSATRAAVGQNGDQLAPLLGLGVEPGAQIIDYRIFVGQTGLGGLQLGPSPRCRV